MTGAEPLITLEEYGQLTDGISYDRACQILGAVGLVQASNIRPAGEGSPGPVLVELVSRSNVDGSTVWVTFENDRLATKSQARLTNGKTLAGRE